MASPVTKPGYHLGREAPNKGKTYPAEVLTEDKPTEINRLRREGFRIAMVGHYPDDIESFHESELSITLTRASGRELPLTDVTLLEDNLERVVDFLDISKMTMRVARENRFFSYVYHLVVGLFALGGLSSLGFAPPGPMTGALFSGGAFALTMLNVRRINFSD